MPGQKTLTRWMEDRERTVLVQREIVGGWHIVDVLSLIDRMGTPRTVAPCCQAEACCSPA